MSLRLTVRQRLLGGWERGKPGRRGCVKACEIQVLQTQKHVSETDLRCDRVTCVSDCPCVAGMQGSRLLEIAAVGNFDNDCVGECDACEFDRRTGLVSHERSTCTRTWGVDGSVISNKFVDSNRVVSGYS